MVGLKSSLSTLKLKLKVQEQVNRDLEAKLRLNASKLEPAKSTHSKIVSLRESLESNIN